jgi:hypothetical protein
LDDGVVQRLKRRIEFLRLFIESCPPCQASDRSASAASPRVTARLRTVFDVLPIFSPRLTPGHDTLTLDANLNGQKGLVTFEWFIHIVSSMLTNYELNTQWGATGLGGRVVISPRLDMINLTFPDQKLMHEI